MARDDGRDGLPTPVHEPAFERCFQDHYAAVLAFAMRRLGSRQPAEDLASETFAVAWRRRERLPDPALPWLYATAAKLLANQRRSLRRREDVEQRLTAEAAISAPHGDPTEGLHQRTAFANAFRRLSTAEREALSLIAWDGLEPREAAVALGCSYPTFRVRFHRARRKLAKHLEALERTPHESHCGPTAEPAEEIG
jgi:RNA polymerase sigma-70 factor (ECF subfamily)